VSLVNLDSKIEDNTECHHILKMLSPCQAESVKVISAVSKKFSETAGIKLNNPRKSILELLGMIDH
jgi:hypothetical protein